MNPAIHDATRYQGLASDPTKHVAVTANAGSGKTRVLVDRVIRLLLAGASPSKILCLTYTKAAASEMQSRLFARLSAWSTLADARLAQQIAELGEETPSAGLASARALFARALETPGGLKIQTIHAFCERILRRFPIEAGIEPGFVILDDGDARQIARIAKDRVAARARAGDAALGAAFQEVAGRTLDDAALDELYAWAGAHASALVAIPNGLEAMRAHVFSSLGADPGISADGARRTAWREAPHAQLRLAADLLESGAKTDVKIAAGLKLALRADSPLRAFHLYYALLFTEKHTPRCDLVTKKHAEKNPLLAELLGGKAAGGFGREAVRFHGAVETINALEAAHYSAAAITLAHAFARSYTEEKTRRGAVDFSDLLAATGALLEDADASAWVLYKLDAGVDHVLVDEAQDTSPEAWRIVHQLTAEFFAGEGAREGARTVFFVGDEKQSIYSFQGADPAAFHAARTALVARANDRATNPQLAVSFRSGRAILTAVDAAFDGEEGAVALTGERADIVRHLAARDDLEGLVELWPLAQSPAKPAADAPWTDPPDTPSEMNARMRLARAVASWVARACQEGTLVSRRVGDARVLTPLRPRDVMILVKKRGPLFDMINRALKEAGVAVSGADRIKLAEEICVQDLLGAARVAISPHDDLAVAELLTSPLAHPIVGWPEPPISDDALFELAHARRKARLIDRLMAHQGQAYRDARRLVLDVRALAEGAGPFDFITGLLDRVSASGETYGERLRARLGAEIDDPLRVLITRAQSFEARRTPSLPGFVQEILNDRTEVKREMTADADEVRVMTVHGAKGLEAPVVILPDAADKPRGRTRGRPLRTPEGAFLWEISKEASPGPLEHASAEAEAKAAAEHLRLLYVAMTRAEDRLIICGAQPGKGDVTGSWYARLSDALLRAGAVEHEDARLAASLDTEESILRLGAPPPASFQAPFQALEPRDASATASPAPGWARRPAPAGAPQARVITPGANEGAVRSPLADLDGARFARGLVIHRLLEVLPELPADARREAGRRLVRARLDLSLEQAEAALEETLRILDDPSFAAVFAPDARAEAALIGRAPELGPDVVVSGRIDRLVVGPDAVLAVDYKTNRPPPRRPEDVASSVLAQMAAYRAILRALYPGRSVRTALLWTDGPHLMALPDSLLDAHRGAA